MAMYPFSGARTEEEIKNELKATKMQEKKKEEEKIEPNDKSDNGEKKEGIF